MCEVFSFTIFQKRGSIVFIGNEALDGGKVFINDAFFFFRRFVFLADSLPRNLGTYVHRKVTGVEYRFIGCGSKGTVEGIKQFPDISRPLVRTQDFKKFRGESLRHHSGFFAYFCYMKHSKVGDVLWSFSQ